jgi:hypothetical protein
MYTPTQEVTNGVNECHMWMVGLIDITVETPIMDNDLIQTSIFLRKVDSV